MVSSRMHYATLDNCPLDGGGGWWNCQEAVLKLPQGWEIAPEDSTAKAALISPDISFGTTCLVFINGASFPRNMKLSCGTKTLVSVKDMYYGVSGCARRVLVRKPAPPGSPDSWKSLVQPTNIFKYRFWEWATLDNAASDSTSICKGKSMMLSDGWKLADADVDSIMAVTVGAWTLKL